MSTAAVSHSVTRSQVAGRRPWLAYAILLALFCVLGPYDLHNRADHEEVTDLKTVAAGQGDAIEEGNWGRRIGVVGLAAFAVVVLFRTRKREMAEGITVVPARTLPERVVRYSVYGYIAVAMASVLWAEEPALAARRVLVFLVLSLAAYALARAWSLADLLTFAIVACGAMLVTSLGLEVVRGAFHPLESDYRLSGLSHPNTHAFECALVIISSVYMYRLDPRNRRLYALAALGAAGIMLITRSRTAVLGLAIGLASVPVLIAPRRRVLWAVIGAAAAGIVVLVYVPDLLEGVKQAALMGRTQETAEVGTLTGRTQLWSALLDYVARRPIFGWGFDAFWTGAHVEEVSVDQGWLVSHAHSGYIENLLNLGIAGLVAFVGALFAGAWAAAKRVQRWHGDLAAGFALTTLMWLIASMFTEAILPQTHYASFMGMIVLAALGWSGWSNPSDQRAVA
jgi:exopolysaccharide production protein ExoQ